MHAILFLNLLGALSVLAHPLNGASRCRTRRCSSTLVSTATNQAAPTLENVAPAEPSTTWTIEWTATSLYYTTASVATERPSSTTTTSTQALPTPSSAAPSATPSSSVSDKSSSTTDSSLVSQYLDPQNSERAKYGASPLSWNDTLASAAQQWANKCVFQHSDGSLGPYGENLSAGTGDFGIGSGIALWTDEASSYDPTNPQPSHFTQVVWKATEQVGCAVAVCDGIFASSYGPANFYVCEYFPQGNVIGYFPENVGSSS